MAAGLRVILARLHAAAAAEWARTEREFQGRAMAEDRAAHPTATPEEARGGARARARARTHADTRV